MTSSGFLAVLSGLALTVVGLAGCAAAPEPATALPTASPGGGGVTVELTAQNLSFDTTFISVPAGARVTVVLVNKDPGIPHNFALYTDSGATTTLFRGDVFPGDATRSYTFTAPSNPGSYFFRCDVHPTRMTGSFIVTGS